MWSIFCMFDDVAAGFLYLVLLLSLLAFFITVWGFFSWMEKVVPLLSQWGFLVLYIGGTEICVFWFSFVLSWPLLFYGTMALLYWKSRSKVGGKFWGFLNKIWYADLEHFECSFHLAICVQMLGYWCWCRLFGQSFWHIAGFWTALVCGDISFIFLLSMKQKQFCLFFKILKGLQH